jgi:hypothetical protein
MTPISETTALMTETRSRKWGSWSACTALFCILLGWTVVLQVLAGAYTAEFSGYPDEPAHYVSGLLIRDYVTAGFPSSPLNYAEDYYLHYPKVAIGLWGPLAHVSEGLWMMVFSSSRTSIMLMMAMITTALAFTLARVIWSEWGFVAGLAAGMTLVAVKLVQRYTGMVMVDNLCALFEFWALLWFGRYLDSERRRDAVLFGLFAAISVLTKSNGYALVLVPPFAILLTRRFRLMKTVNFWIPAVMVIILDGAWIYFSLRLASGIASRQVSAAIAFAYFPLLVSVLGPWLMPFVLIGLFDRLLPLFRGGTISGRWTAAACMLPAFWIMHSVAPSTSAEDRYVAAVVAPLLMFFTAGLMRVANFLPVRFPLPYRAAVLALACACIFAKTSFAIPPQRSYGFAEVAKEITSRPDLRDCVMLISTEGFGEGMMVAEVAMLDHRPGIVVLRATKMLARVNWIGEHYELRYTTPEEMMKALQEIPVRILVVDKTPGLGPMPHHRLLLKMLEMYRDQWQLLGVYPQKVHVTETNSRIEVYRLKGAENRSRNKIRLDLRYTLGRFIER